MNRKKIWLPILLAGAALAVDAQTAPTKIGVINIQAAVLGTKDGQKAATELQTMFLPKRQEIEKRQGEVQSLQAQLRASSNTASEEVKNKLMRDIDTKNKSLKRDVEDAQAEFDQQQQKVLSDIGAKIMAVLDKYATDNGYAVVIDVSTQQSPVLFASPQVEITRQIIDLYDKNAPAAATPQTPAAKPPASPPATAAPKAPAAPPVKP